MPVLNSLPDPDTIRRLKGTLDYYVWKGLPCVRKWPVTPKAHLTSGTLTQSARYSSWLKRAHLTAAEVQAVANDVARQSNWTWRDFICFAIAGNLYNQP